MNERTFLLKTLRVHKPLANWAICQQEYLEHKKRAEIISFLTCIHQWSWRWYSQSPPLLWLAEDTLAWSRRAWCSPAGFWTCCKAGWHSQTVMCGPWHWPDAGKKSNILLETLQIPGYKSEENQGLGLKKFSNLSKRLSVTETRRDGKWIYQTTFRSSSKCIQHKPWFSLWHTRNLQLENQLGSSGLRIFSQTSSIE